MRAQLVKNRLQCRRFRFDSWVRKIRWRRDRLPTLVFLSFPCGSTERDSACNTGDLGFSQHWEDLLEEGMATHSSMLFLCWCNCLLNGLIAHNSESSQGFPDSSVGKESTCNAGDPGLIPGSQRLAGEGIGYPLEYSWASLVTQLVKNPPAMCPEILVVPREKTPTGAAARGNP